MKKKELKNIYHNRKAVPLIFMILLFSMPLVITSKYLLTIFIMIGIYALVCNGMTLLTGFAGQISLGHAAFYGIGAYTSAILTTNYGLSPWIGMIAGMIIAALIALIVGIPTFKLKGHYLALATLGFGIIIYTAFKELKTLTGGSNGFLGIPPIKLFGFQFNSDLDYFYLIWVFVFIGFIFSRNIIHSRIGRALRSIEGSEVASDAVGINIMSYKLQVFMLSAMFASVAGSLMAHYVSFINPDLFGTMTSIYFLIMVIIGGSSRIWGSILGAAVYVLLGELLKQYLPILVPQVGEEFQIVFFGVLLVVTLIYMPNGLAPELEKLFSKMKRKKTAIHPQVTVRREQSPQGVSTND